MDSDTRQPQYHDNHSRNGTKLKCSKSKNTNEPTLSEQTYFM